MKFSWATLSVAAVLAANVVQARDVGVVDAQYAEPTTRYTHGILGDAIEHGALQLTLSDGRTVSIRLPETHVFEDTEPRLVDVDLDGLTEAMVVETSMAQGARLAIYNETGVVAAAPYIGRTNRWLAPIGAADFDRDGRIEIGYIDRPHLAKTLRIWRFDDSALTLVDEIAGLTNHRIGEADIGGGLRRCDGQVEMITASADWSRVIATGFVDGSYRTRDMGPHRGRASLNAALAC